MLRADPTNLTGEPTRRLKEVMYAAGATALLGVAALVVFLAQHPGSVPQPGGLNAILARFSPTDGSDLAHHNSHAFSFTHPDGSPVSWDRCDAITVEVNARHAPAGALADVVEAARLISQASGVQFDFIGPSDVIPSGDVDTRRADVVVAWASPQQSFLFELAGDMDAAAVGGPDYLPDGDSVRFVSGSVVVNSKAVLPGGFGPATQGSLLLHEFGHLVGLAHTTDQTQIMAAGHLSAGTLGAGDLAGLEALRPSCG